MTSIIRALIRIHLLQEVRLEKLEIIRIGGGLMMALRGWLLVLIIYSAFNSKATNSMNMIYLFSLAILMICFMSRRTIRFYFLFESILIPIFILIIG